MSNQFVEIKGSVFKKFEKDNLFQITCAGLLILFYNSAVKILSILDRYRGAILSWPYAFFRCVSKFNRTVRIRIRFQRGNVPSKIVRLDWRQRFMDNFICEYSP